MSRILAVLALSVMLGSLFADPGKGAQIHSYVPGTLVVKFAQPLDLPEDQPGKTVGLGPVRTGLASVDALNVKYNVTNIERLFPGAKPPAPGSNYKDLTRYYVLDFPVEVDLDVIAADYNKDPNLVSAEKDALTYLHTSTPNDPRYTAGDQWPLNDATFNYDLDMQDAWDYERGDSLVLLGIIDTGILRTHIDLGGTAGNDFTDGNIWINWPEYYGGASVDDDSNGYVDDWWGWDWVTAGGLWPGEDGLPADNDPSDFAGHGTHVSGIAAAMTDNGLGVAGVAGGWYTGQRGCRVMALRIGYQADDGNGLVQSSKTGPAVEYARDKGVTAINMSFGVATITATVDAVTNALLDGIIVVHSAGNDDDTLFSVIDTLTVLGTTNRVISVASISKTGHKSGFSTYGSWVDVSAPGSDVWSTYSIEYTQTYASLDGTSMSSPHVVGLAGLMKSNFPAATGEQIREWILNTTKDIDSINPGYAGLLGSGTINANNFFSAVPVAKFGVTSETRGHVPFPVSFEDSSMAPAWDPIDSLLWDFGDGNFSNDTNPTHIYTTPGLFSVKMYAWSDSFGSIYGVSSQAHMDDLVFVIADSVYTGEGHGKAGETKIPVPIFYRNVYPVNALTVPIKFAGIDSLDCDSVSFNNSRISSFLVKSASINNTNKTILIQGSHLSALDPGEGLLATAYFSLDSSTVVGDTAVVDTAIIGGSSLEVESTDQIAGIYDPKFISSFVAVEPWPRGDVNKSGKLELADAIALVNYIFSKPGFPAPDPFWLGDFSANGKIEIPDVIMIVNRILKGI
jgi:subtilisin family serine protease